MTEHGPQSSSIERCIYKEHQKRFGGTVRPAWPVALYIFWYDRKRLNTVMMPNATKMHISTWMLVWSVYQDIIYMKLLVLFLSMSTSIGLCDMKLYSHHSLAPPTPWLALPPTAIPKPTPSIAPLTPNIAPLTTGIAPPILCLSPPSPGIGVGVNLMERNGDSVHRFRWASVDHNVEVSHMVHESNKIFIFIKCRIQWSPGREQV